LKELILYLFEASHLKNVVNHIPRFCFLMEVRFEELGGLSKNQKKILELLAIKPEMTTKEIAELLFSKTVEYKSQEYASVHRSLVSLEKQKCLQRVQIHLRWRRISASESAAP
jgi:hypothetical protein